jgi:predicted Zn-dependent protease with MMP-like domain
MSTKEMLKHRIDVLPDELVDDVNDYVSLIFDFSMQQKKSESDLEKAYRTLEKFKGRIDRPIDYKKERLEYLDEKYGPID